MIAGTVTMVPTQVVVQQSINLFPRLNRSALMGLSIVNILASVAVLILEILVITFGQGFWSGIFFCSSGILGCIMAKRPTRGGLQATIVLGAVSIISAITSAVLLGLIYCYSGACYIWTGVQISHIVFDVISIGSSIGMIIIAAQAVCSNQPPAMTQYSQPPAYANPQYPQYQQAFPQQFQGNPQHQQAFPQQVQGYPQQQQQFMYQQQVMQQQRQKHQQQWHN